MLDDFQSISLVDLSRLLDIPHSRFHTGDSLRKQLSLFFLEDGFDWIQLKTVFRKLTKIFIIINKLAYDWIKFIIEFLNLSHSLQFAVSEKIDYQSTKKPDILVKVATEDPHRRGVLQKPHSSKVTHLDGT